MSFIIFFKLLVHFLGSIILKKQTLYTTFFTSYFQGDDMNMKYVFIILALSILTFLALPFQNADSNLTIAGSTSVQPFCEELVEEYKKSNPDVDINVQGGGSSLGVKCANNSAAHIGMASKDVNESNLIEYELGKEGMAIVVNNANPVDDLSSDDLRDIFSGNITDWREVSNKSGNINVFVREEGSGTFNAFKSIIMDDSDIKDDAVVQNSAGAIKQSVVQDKDAIAFVSLCHLDKNIKSVRVDGVEISQDSIKNGSYRLQRPFVFLTNKTPSKETLDFINWSLSDESSEIFQNEGIIKID